MLDEEREIRLPGEAIPPVIPQPVERVEMAEVPEPEEEPDELADLFTVPQPEDNDMRTDIALDLDVEDVIGGEEDMSDLVDVPEEVFTGEPPAPEPPPPPKPRYRIVRRPIRREPPPTSLRGIQ